MTTWCTVCRSHRAPSRSQAEHEASESHKANGRQPERRIRAGTRLERLALRELEAVG